MSTLISRHGPWRPQLSGVPLPSELDVHTGPFKRMCFPASWEPHILMALKLLARPETYLGSLANISTMVRNAETLMGEIEDGCASADCPNFYLTYPASAGPYDLTNNSHWIADTCEVCSERIVYAAFARVDFFTQISRASWELRDPVDDSSVGGRICSITAFCTPDAVNNVWTQQWLDCQGTTHIETILGSAFVLSNIDARWIVISALKPFVITVSVAGPQLCIST